MHTHTYNVYKTHTHIFMLFLQDYAVFIVAVTSLCRYTLCMLHSDVQRSIYAYCIIFIYNITSISIFLVQPILILFFFNIHIIIYSYITKMPKKLVNNLLTLHNFMFVLFFYKLSELYRDYVIIIEMNSSVNILHHNCYKSVNNYLLLLSVSFSMYY